MKKDDLHECYICGGKHESDDHCPPKCFFPKGYRSNLMTVPSCMVHNEQQSEDDEYTREVVLSFFENNQIAYSLFDQKVKPVFERSEKAKKRFLKNTKTVYYRQGIKFVKTIAPQIERDVFDRTMRKIGYGIYFYKFKHRWMRNLIVATPCLYDANMRYDEQGTLVAMSREIEKHFNITYEGSNPNIFKYVFFDTETSDTILKMVFYNGFEVYLIPCIGSTSPSLD